MVGLLVKRAMVAASAWVGLAATSSAFYYSVDYKTGGLLTTSVVSADHVLNPPSFWHHYVWTVHNPYNFTLKNVGMVRTFGWITIQPTPGVASLTDYVANVWDDANKQWKADSSTNTNILSGEHYRASYYNVHDSAQGGNLVQTDLFSMSRGNTDIPLTYTPGSRTYSVYDSTLNQDVSVTVNFQSASLSESDNVPVIWIGDIAAGADAVFDVYLEEDHDLSNIFAGYSTGFYVTTTAVPEPSTMAALAVGGLALLARRKKM